MSKNRGIKQYSNPVNEFNNDDVEIVEEVLGEPEINVEIKNNEVGIVIGCNKLHVRKRPNVNSASLYILNKGTELILIENESTDKFYKVCTLEGVEGFCMKDFVTIKR